MTPFPDSELDEREILQALAAFRGARILEIGAGDGRLIRHYVAEAALVVGLDNDAGELAAAREDYLESWPGVPLAQGSADSLPFPDASFDLVVFGWSLCCVAPSQASQALREALRVARQHVLDIRAALPPPEVWLRDRFGSDIHCGPLTRRADLEHNVAATRAVEAGVREGWLRVAAAREFDWLDAYESGDDLVGEVTEEWDNWMIDEDLALNFARALERAGRGARPFIRQGVRAQVLARPA